MEVFCVLFGLNLHSSRVGDRRNSVPGPSCLTTGECGQVHHQQDWSARHLTLTNPADCGILLSILMW